MVPRIERGGLQLCKCAVPCLAMPDVVWFATDVCMRRNMHVEWYNILCTRFDWHVLLSTEVCRQVPWGWDSWGRVHSVSNQTPPMSSWLYRTLELVSPFWDVSRASPSSEDGIFPSPAGSIFEHVLWFQTRTFFPIFSQPLMIIFRFR